MARRPAERQRHRDRGRFDDARPGGASRSVVVVVFQFATELPQSRPDNSTRLGSNPEAAQLIGLSDPAASIFTAFVLSGALAGFAGFMTLARFGNITVEAARGLGTAGGGGRRGRRRQHLWRLGHASMGALLGAVHDRDAGAEPVPPADQRILCATRCIGLADPARGGERCQSMLKRLRMLWARSDTDARRRSHAVGAGGEPSRDRHARSGCKSWEGIAARAPGRDRGGQHRALALLSRHRQPREPVPARRSRRSSSHCCP